MRLLNPRRWSERTMIALVMQNHGQLDHDVHQAHPVRLHRYLSKQGHGEPNPSWIPVGNEVTRRIAKKIDGVAGGTWGELFNIPLTAHFLGGAVIGDSAEHGVIDAYHRVWNYPTLSVVDGAAISANLGVNPSLSITRRLNAPHRCGRTRVSRICGLPKGSPTGDSTPSSPRAPWCPRVAPAALDWG